MARPINWLGFAAGVATILLIGISIYVPWWVVQVGDGLLSINTSPLNVNFSVANQPAFAIPLIWALNLATILTLAVGGIILLVYSFVPAKSYGKKLLEFSYKKPIYAIVFFVVSLIALVVIVRTTFGINIPLMGSEKVMLPQSMTFGATISALITSGLLWPFWFGVVTAGLCVAARLYHSRVVNQSGIQVLRQQNMSSPSSQAES